MLLISTDVVELHAKTEQYQPFGWQQDMAGCKINMSMHILLAFVLANTNWHSQKAHAAK